MGVAYQARTRFPKKWMFCIELKGKINRIFICEQTVGMEMSCLATGCLVLHIRFHLSERHFCICPTGSLLFRSSLSCLHTIGSLFRSEDPEYLPGSSSDNTYWALRCFHSSAVYCLGNLVLWTWADIKQNSRKFSAWFCLSARLWCCNKVFDQKKAYQSSSFLNVNHLIVQW